MKRIRPQFSDAEPEPTDKQHQRFIRGPFDQPPDQFWINFWLDTLPFLSTRNLFILSCTSQHSYSLVWAHLIPAHKPGLRFYCHLPTQRLEKYLSQVPSLCALHLEELTPAFMGALAKLPSLSSISLPKGLSKTPIPFQTISHLTGLISFSGEGLENPLEILKLEKLHEFRLHNPTGLISGAIIGRLTNLHSLSVEIEYETHCPHVHRLTNLTSLTMAKSPHSANHNSPHKAPGIPLLTRLRVLKIHSLATRMDYSTSLCTLTNLQTLDLKGGLNASEFPKVCMALTNLTDLSFREGADIIERHFPRDLTPISYLTSLRRLSTIGSEFTPESVACLPATLRVLKLLYLPLKNNNALAGLTNLTSLHLEGNVFPIVPTLTNLQTLVIKGHSPNPVWADLEFLTKLTSFSIAYQKFNPVLEGLKGLTGLEKLQFLSCSDVSRETFETITQHFTRLEHLSVFLSDVTRETGPVAYLLEPLYSLKRLEHLRLNESQVVVREFWEHHLAFQETKPIH